MPQSAFSFELKSLSETGEFEGAASVYGVVDEGGDQVIQGAFTKTLEAGREIPILWQHRDPVGRGTLTDSPAALLVKGRLSLDLQQAKDVHVMLKDRIISGLSIGFQTIKSDVEGGVRKLKELKLYEVSLVCLPMNPAARVFAVKSIDEARLFEELRDLSRETKFLLKK